MVIATSALAVLIAAASALAATTPLDDAPVPSLCEHPAGQLVDGELPGIPANAGFVALAALERPHMIATGRVRERGDRAAVVACNAGGVSWPDNIVVYSPAKTILGYVELGEVTHGGREIVRRISIRRRVVHIDVIAIWQNGDGACCGSASAHVKLEWDRGSKRIRVAGKTIYTERRLIKRLVRAVDRGRRGTVHKLAPRPLANALLAIHDDGARLDVEKCYVPRDSDDWIKPGEYAWVRACRVGITSASGEPVGRYALYAKHGRGSYRFKVIGYRNLAP